MIEATNARIFLADFILYCDVVTHLASKILRSQLTARVTCAGADSGTPSDGEKAEAGKTPVKRADSPASGARIVGRRTRWRARLSWTCPHEAFAALEHKQLCGNLCSARLMLYTTDTLVPQVQTNYKENWLRHEAHAVPTNNLVVASYSCDGTGCA